MLAVVLPPMRGCMMTIELPRMIGNMANMPDANEPIVALSVVTTAMTRPAVSAAAYAITIPLSWRYRTRGGPIRFTRTRFDIPLRALTVAIVVAVVTALSSTIGSFASGMFALFPIILGSSIVIMHPRIGGKATASMLAHAQLFLMGLAFGGLALHYLVTPIGVWPALGVALCVCLVWSGILVVIGTRRRKATAA